MKRSARNVALVLPVLVALGFAAGSAQQADRLSDPGEARANEFQPPALVLDLLGVRPGLVIGEVGAGRGRFTVHLADRVGPTGHVYANDIDARALAALEGRCRRLRLSNVELVYGAPDNANFPADKLDAVIMTWVYHHVDRPVELLRSLLPSLKGWGRVAMVEPTPAATEPRRRPLTAQSVGDDARAAGFQLDAVIEGRFKTDTVFVLRPQVPDAPESHDPVKVRALWLEYVTWRKAAIAGNSPRAWAEQLERQGVPTPEVRRRLQVVRAQFTEQPEGIEFIYDQTYGQPLTGSLEKDGFKTAPNAFLVEAAQMLKAPGRALDVGTGMGRNAIHLATLGWDVTGIDLSAEGLKVLAANAAKAKLHVATVRTSYLDYDFGVARWDLVAMILSWAPIEDPAFLARLKASVKPGGYVMFEHVLQRSTNPFPPGVHAPERGAMKQYFGDFEIVVLRELDDYGDWGGPPTAHVRMLARKPPATM